MLASRLLALAGCSLGDDDDQPAAARAPSRDDEEAAAKLGFPSTRHARTRSAWAAATPPPTPPAWPAPSSRRPATPPARPRSCSSTADDWQAARRGVRARRPARSARRSCCPTAATCRPSRADTLERLEPKGSDLSKDAQVIRIGDEAGAAGRLQDRRRSRATTRTSAPPRSTASSRPRKGKPSANVVVVLGRARPSTRCRPPPGRRAPATRCCSPQRDSVPDADRKALREHEQPNIYVLGPRAGRSRPGGREAAREGLGTVRRDRGGPTPVENAIAFARYRAGRVRLGRRSCPATTSRSPAPRGRSTPPPRRRSPRAACSRRCS